MSLKIGLVQIAELTWPHRKREQYVYQNGVLVEKTMRAVADAAEYVYLPLSVGLMQAHAMRHCRRADEFEFQTPIFKRLPIAEAVQKLAGVDVVAFSLYVWNINLSVAIIRALKRLRPEVIVIVGGPQVPDRAEDWLRREVPEIDIAVHGEGEQVFTELLDRVDDRRSWSEVASVSFLDGTGRFVNTPRAARIRDLGLVPSPYLDGVFEPLLAENPDKAWLVSWETNRGCPFSCTFCDWGSAVGGKVNRFDLERLEGEIDWFARHSISHLFVVDANFGILPRDVEIAKALVKRYEASSQTLSVHIQNAKNASERAFEIHKIFDRSSLIHFGATLSLQTVSVKALEDIKRQNISLDSYHDLHVRFREEGIETYTDLILGLPGESYDSFAGGLSEIIARGQHNRIACYNCSVLPNAEMGDPAYIEKHGIEYQPTPMVYMHEGLDREDRAEVLETLNTIVATRTMPRADWVRARVFGWAVECFHFDRLLQIPSVAMANLAGVGYRRLFETLIGADEARFPILAEIRRILTRQAEVIQEGGAEWIASPKWLNIWWPADQFVVLTLVNEHKLAGFYREAEILFHEILDDVGEGRHAGTISEAIALNRARLRVPKEYEDLEVTLSSNLHDYVEAAISGTPIALEAEPTRFRIDRSSTVWITRRAWCEEVVTFHYKRTEFLYPIQPLGARDGYVDGSPAVVSTHRIRAVASAEARQPS